MKTLLLIAYSLDQLTTPRSTSLAQPMLAVGLETQIITEYKEVNFLNKSQEKIIQEIREFQPGLIIYDCNDGRVGLEVVKEVQFMKIPILVPVWDSPYFPWIGEIEAYWLSTATVIFVSDSLINYYKYRALTTCFSNLKSVVFYGGNHVNTEIFKHSLTEKNYDVFLVGSQAGRRGEMLGYLEEIFSGNNISFYRGGGFDGDKGSIEKDGSSEQTLTYTEYVSALNQSRICLNQVTFEGNNHIRGRIFEYLACGAFCLTNYTSEVERFFPADCLVMYKDFDDCAEKIKYYLEKEEKRQSIAQKGYEWFHHSFNYRHFWRDFLEAVAIKDYQRINLIGESGLPSQYRIG